MGTTEDTENTENAHDEAVNGRPTKLIEETLTGVIRQTAFDTHRYFGHGFLEKVYENALANRLRKQGFNVATQAALAVSDEDGTVVGEYVADMVVEGRVVPEIKAVSGLAAEHQAQVINYLKASGLRVGMLLNFGQSRLQVRRFAL